MAGMGYRRDIDGLRAVAVLPVVLNHADLPGFGGGFVGVDIFFVISGFLITGILAEEIEAGRFSILRFYERRARRILPALMVVLAACLVGGWFLLSPERYESLGKSTLATLLFSSNLWFWQEAADYFAADVKLQPLLHTWSLAVEEQFYLFFPILLWVIARLRAGWIGIVAALSAASLLLSVWMTTTTPIANFYLMPTRIWELGAGALLALGAFPRSLSRFSEVIGWLGLGLILTSMALITEHTPFPGLAALGPVLGATLLILAGAGAGSGASRLLSLRPLVWIGLLSYSLYLWHWPILVAAKTALDTPDLGFGTALACVLASILAAWTSWRWVERPFRKPRAQGGFSGRQILGFSGAATVCIMTCAAVILSQRGVVGQFPPERTAAYKRAIRTSSFHKACMNLPENAPPCRIGSPEATPDTVIWGDSHAGALLPGFDDWLRAKGHGALAFTKSGCVPLLGVARADKSDDHDCDDYNAGVLAAITSVPAIREVILVGRWAFYTEGTRNEGGEFAILTESGKSPIGIEDNARLVADGLDRLLTDLTARGIVVRIIASIPEIGRDVPSMLISGDPQDWQAQVPDRAAYDARNKRTNEILERASTRKGVVLHRPAGIMCKGACTVQLEGEALYRDDDHLSVAGARWLVPQLMANGATSTPSR